MEHLQKPKYFKYLVSIFFLKLSAKKCNTVTNVHKFSAKSASFERKKYVLLKKKGITKICAPMIFRSFRSLICINL